MPAIVTSVFGRVVDFAAAMRAEAHRSFVVRRRGDFRAALTQVPLEYLHISAVEENLPRISFVNVPEGWVLTCFALDGRTRHIWGGCPMGGGELVVIGPAQSIHVCSDGPSHWGMIWFPAEQMRDYSRSLLGRPLTLAEAVGQWRPRKSLFRRLLGLHRFIIQAAHKRPENLTEARVVHGLEQQLIYALLETLSEGPMVGNHSDQVRRQKLMALFEHIVTAHADGESSMAQVCAALDVSEQTLCQWCEETFAMGPLNYISLRNESSPGLDR